MKRVIRVLFIGILIISLLVSTGPSAFVTAEEPSGDTRICTSWEELLGVLASDPGGRIELDMEGAVHVSDTLNISVTKPVVVVLPQDGIVVDEDEIMRVKGPITFEGVYGFTLGKYASVELSQGTSIHVRSIDGIRSAVAISCGYISSAKMDSTVSVTAEGDQAIGIYSYSDDKFDLGYARISVSGSNACAIKVLGDLKLSSAYLDASGSDSCAISSQGTVELGQVSATGAVLGQQVYSILSMLSDPPDNIFICDVTPKPEDQSTMIYQNLAYGCIPVTFDKQITYNYSYKLPESSDFFDSLVGVTCQPTWDLDGLDYSITGEYHATATLTPLIPIPGLTVPAFHHKVTVVPSNRAALYADAGGWGYTEAYCLTPIVDATEVLFWIYDVDTGWKELTATDQAEYTIENYTLTPGEDVGTFRLYELAEDTYYWVIVQVIGGPMAGFSNLWVLYTGYDLGGDRTGTDRAGPKPNLPPSDEDNPGGDTDETSATTGKSTETSATNTTPTTTSATTTTSTSTSGTTKSTSGTSDTSASSASPTRKEHESKPSTTNGSNGGGETKTSEKDDVPRPGEPVDANLPQPITPNFYNQRSQAQPPVIAKATVDASSITKDSLTSTSSQRESAEVQTQSASNPKAVASAQVSKDNQTDSLIIILFGIAIVGLGILLTVHFIRRRTKGK